MSFLHWWAIGIGAAALVAPLAVHFLTKPRPVAYSLSTVRFLREVIEQRKARSRFRDWLILLLRGLCIALLALGLSRPLLEKPPAVSTQASGDTARVIVLDISQSMSAGSGGVTAWTQAQTSSLQYLELNSGSLANVVFAGARARSIFDSLSPNLNGLRSAVKQARPHAERCEPRDALELAGRMLAAVEGGTKELLVISDFQRSNWGTLFLELIPADVKIQFHSVASDDLGNVAIESVGFTSEPIIGQPAVLEVQLANYSEREAQVRCRVDLSGVQRVLEATLLPQSTQTLAETVTLDAAGWNYGWAKLENNLDSLPNDDERPLAVRVRPAVRVLIVTAQNTLEVPSSSFYLERVLNVALSPIEGDTNATPIVRVNPQRDDFRSWPDSDVLVLDHPGALGKEVLQSIASQLRRGRGMLYVTSELVDAVNLEQLAQLLGGDFQPPVTLHPAEKVGGRKDLFVQRIAGRQMPFDILGSNTASALQGVRFSGGLASRTTSEGLRDQVLAELSDTSALLYVSSVGAGQLAILNTDLGRSNWSIHPTFLPVISELARALLAGRGGGQQVACGEPMVRMLPPTIDAADELSAVTVEGEPPPEDNFGSWQWSAGQGSVVWNWPEPAGVGIYALRDASQPVWMVATSAPAAEADLQSLDQEILSKRMTGTRGVGFSSSQSPAEETDNTWSWFIVACLLGLIAEIVALRFSRM
ncbi:MAG: BatA and WFA domain-containing protein [Pirellulaceae bacterium]